MRLLCGVLFGIILFGTCSYAQHTPSSEAGFLGYYGYNMHSADFGGIPVPYNCCRDYNDGSGNGWSAGLLYRRYFASDWAVSGRLVYSDLSAKFQYWEASEITLAEPPGTRTATFDNSIRATIRTLGIEPLVEYHGLGVITLMAGLHLGIPIAMDYRQEEYMLTPEDLVYLDGNRFRNKDEGTIPDAAGVFFSAVAGVGVRIYPGMGFTITPEVSYLHTFNDVMDGSDWKPHTLRIGVALQTAY